MDRRRFLLAPLCLLPLPALAAVAPTVTATPHAGNLAKMAVKLHPITALIPGGGFPVPREWYDQIAPGSWVINRNGLPAILNLGRKAHG